MHGEKWIRAGVAVVASVLLLSGTGLTTRGFEIIPWQPAQNLQQRKQARMAYLQQRITDLHTVCKLSDAQRKRLTIAAKGAVHYWHESQLGGHQPLPNQKIRRMGLQLQVQQQMLVRGGKFLLANPAGDNAADVAKQPIWSKTVGRVLTDQQQAAYSKALDERVAAKRGEMLDGILKTVSQVNRLSKAQTAKAKQALEKLVDKDLRELSAEQLKTIDAATLAMTHQAEYIKALTDIVPAPRLQLWSVILQQQQQQKMFQKQRIWVRNLGEQQLDVAPQVLQVPEIRVMPQFRAVPAVQLRPAIRAQPVQRPLPAARPRFVVPKPLDEDDS